MWRKVSYCSDLECGERLEELGLSEDGNYCFLSDGDEAIVWDVLASRIIWRLDYDDPFFEDKDQEDKEKDGFVKITQGVAEGTYYLFGPFLQTRPGFEASYGLSFIIDEESGTLHLADVATGQVCASLPFKHDKGNWAHASMSKDGRTIIVFQPYGATFFRRDDI